MTRDELLSGRDMDAMELGEDAVQHAQIARANTLYSARIIPVPPVVPPTVAPVDDQPRHVGDIPAPVTSRGYGPGSWLALIARLRATEGETA